MGQFSRKLSQMFNYIHRIDGATVNEVLINNLAFTEVGGGGGGGGE